MEYPDRVDPGEKDATKPGSGCEVPRRSECSAFEVLWRLLDRAFPVPVGITAMVGRHACGRALRSSKIRVSPDSRIRVCGAVVGRDAAMEAMEVAEVVVARVCCRE
jgi:hypothetical protein